ncbi:MAG: c-type cytochrome [Granulosicoccus sp.]|nr:c-type cytochrome [Granulosicoccus sp.]
MDKIPAPITGLCLCLLYALSLTLRADQAPPFNQSPPRLGSVMSAESLEQLPKHVFADGEGLPEGRGTTELGAVLYAEQCAACHGAVGQGGRAIELVGERSSLTSEYPDRGIAVYWPHAPSLFEYIYRSMPPENPASLSADQLYSLIAYLFQLNDLLPEGSELDAQSLRAVQMPNRSGFVTIGN